MLKTGIILFKNALIALLLLTVLSVPSQAEVGEDIAKQSDEILALANIEKPKNTGKWLPVPIPISNPTVGSGLTLGLLYLHPEKEENSGAKAATSGIGVMYTGTQSWFGGAFHDNNWFDDRLRLTAMVGTGELNMKFYGVGSDSIFSNNPVRYTIEPWGFSVKLLAEPFQGSRWYFGMRHLYTSADIIFKTSEYISFLPDIHGNSTTSGVGVVVDYDSRDDTYYPSVGSYFELMMSRDDPAWGSDYTFSKWTGFYTHYFPVSDKAVIAARGDVSLAEGGTPFYMLPSLNMRGFSSGRYSDKTVASVHVEWRHKFHPRWGYLLSYEGGYTHDTLAGIWEGRYAYALGVGLRWQVLKDKKIHLGLDFGFNEEDQSLCVQVGERF